MNLDGLTPPYGCICADPPWPYDVTQRLGGSGRRTSAHAGYRRMTLEDIVAVPVGALAAESAHLWLWVTHQVLIDGLHVPVLESWGFEGITIATWIKRGRIGLGTYLRSSSEHVIFARRGFGTVPETPWPTTWFEAPRGRHSVKPGCWWDIVRAISPGPYVELWAREPQLGVDSWGTGYELESRPA